MSVVIPAYNAEATVRRTLESAASQTHRNIEIIIVDDGSTDSTADIVSQFASIDPRATVLRQGNLGVAAARNSGMNHASGDYIAPLDADDIWHPTKIEKQLRVIERRSSIGLVYTWYRIIDEADRVIETPAPALARGHVFTWLIVENFIGNASSPLIRKSILEQSGGYDISLRAAGAEGAEDLRMQFDIASLAEVDFVPEYLVGYRRSSGAMSAKYQTMLRSQYLVLKHIRQHWPTLPRKLFRWSEGEAAAYYGMLLASKDRRAGIGLLALAINKDPVAAWHLIAKPVYRNLRRKIGKNCRRIIPSGSRLGVRRHNVNDDASCIGRAFSDADPAVMWTSEPPSWNRQRIRIAQIYQDPQTPSGRE